MVIDASVYDVDDVVAAGSLEKVMLPQRENQQIFENSLSFMPVSCFSLFDPKPSFNKNCNFEWCVPIKI